MLLRLVHHDCWLQVGRLQGKETPHKGLRQDVSPVAACGRASQCILHVLRHLPRNICRQAKSISAHISDIAFFRCQMPHVTQSSQLPATIPSNKRQMPAQRLCPLLGSLERSNQSNIHRSTHRRVYTFMGAQTGIDWQAQVAQGLADAGLHSRVVPVCRQRSLHAGAFQRRPAPGGCARCGRGSRAPLGCRQGLVEGRHPNRGCGVATERARPGPQLLPRCFSQVHHLTGAAKRFLTLEEIQKRCMQSNTNGCCPAALSSHSQQMRIHFSSFQR